MIDDELMSIIIPNSRSLKCLKLGNCSVISEEDIIKLQCIDKMKKLHFKFIEGLTKSLNNLLSNYKINHIIIEKCCRLNHTIMYDIV